MKIKSLLVINGPNMNMLGIREPEIYGTNGYDFLVNAVTEFCKGKNIFVKCFQSNHEGSIIDEIQAAYGVFDAIVINPAAYTHTSIAIADALRAVCIPACEVHISDVEAREDFRKISYCRDACIATVSGMGINGYIEAVKILLDYDKEGN